MKTSPIGASDTKMSSNQYSTSQPPASFWSGDKGLVIGLFVFLVSIYFTFFDGDKNKKQPETKSSVQQNVTSSNTININNYLGTWSSSGTCDKVYWWIDRDRYQQYTITYIDKLDSKENYVYAVSSYNFFENYPLDSGKFIKNVMRFNINDGAIFDISFVGSPKKAIKFYQLELSSDDLIVTQGLVVKNGRSTILLYKCE
ncbi:MAG: hypothetical protein HQ456_01405 [Polynucleobacter sp.]|nr:hypothetical protein [Polynucleobacter sp.]